MLGLWGRHGVLSVRGDIDTIWRVGGTVTVLEHLLT